MKKFMFALMLAAVLLFTASPLFAEGMMFGVKGGLNMANLSGDDVSAPDEDQNGHDRWRVPLLQYHGDLRDPARAAFHDEGRRESTFRLIDASIKANYIEIPLLFKVTLPTEGKIKPSLYAGPALGILMSAKAEAWVRVLTSRTS